MRRKNSNHKATKFIVIFVISLLVGLPLLLHSYLAGTEASASNSDYSSVGPQEDGSSEDNGSATQPEEPEQNGDGSTSDEPESESDAGEADPEDDSLDQEEDQGPSADDPDTSDGVQLPDTPENTENGSSGPDDPISEGDTTADYDNWLFIGDSRTVGISEYGNIDGAAFFCDVGMSVYNVNKTKVSIPSVGSTDLAGLLASKSYENIYIMLGINELGYDMDTTVERYSELVDQIRQAQPDATLYIEANLHVSKSRSDTDKIFNNTAIDAFNSAIAQLADGESIKYLDANVLFDDENGALSSDYTWDGTHVFAKHYITWSDWIIEQTGS